MSDSIFIKKFLSFPEQKEIVEAIKKISPGFYQPKTKWGGIMKIKMNCLGHHWSAIDYKYHKNRVDADSLPCAPIPDYLQQIARKGLLESGYLQESEIIPYNICIVNWYGEADGKLGVHQDNSETRNALESGYPILSLSIGSSSIFVIGGEDRKGDYDEHIIESGDLFIFGRTKRLAFHGIKKLLAGTTPEELGFKSPGRINLTFRIL